MGEIGECERGGCEATTTGWGEGERAQFWYWEEGVGEGDLKGKGHEREGVNTRPMEVRSEPGEGKGAVYTIVILIPILPNV